MLKPCPNHEVTYDFVTLPCEICGDTKQYNPDDMISCQVPKCEEQLTKDIYIEELGFCVEHSHAYYDHELDPYTLERVESAS